MHIHIHRHAHGYTQAQTRTYTHHTCTNTQTQSYTDKSQVLLPRAVFLACILPHSTEMLSCWFSAPPTLSSSQMAPPLSLLPRLFPFSLHSPSPADLVVECKNNSRQWNVRVGAGETSHGRKAAVPLQSSGGTKAILYSSSESASGISGFQVKDSSHLPPEISSCHTYYLLLETTSSVASPFPSITKG